MKSKISLALFCLLCFAFEGFAATKAKVSEVAKRAYPYMVNSKGDYTKDKSIAKKEYILVYFSAKWCPPCRAFTPKLVDFYKQNKKGDNFEIIFVSSDSSSKDMLKYMKEYKMPWPGIKHSKTKDSKLKEYAGSGIPCLVMFDKEGNVISDSYVNGKYVGPTKVMNDLKNALASK